LEEISPNIPRMIKPGQKVGEMGTKGNIRKMKELVTGSKAMAKL